MKYIYLGMFIMTMQVQGATAVPEEQKNRAVRVEYSNWRGETAIRTIIPIEIYWGKTEWHPQEQWLLRVWDVERDAERSYALKDIKQWL